MPYVDGFLLPVKKKDVQAYRRMAQQAGMPMDPKRMRYGGFKVVVDL